MFIDLLLQSQKVKLILNNSYTVLHFIVATNLYFVVMKEQMMLRQSI